MMPKPWEVNWSEETQVASQKPWELNWGEPAPTAEPIQESDGPLKKAAKTAYSASTGVAEALNPLAVPRNAEILIRSFGEEASPDKSFFGRLGERLSKAETKAVLPPVKVRDIAAGVRTFQRMPEIMVRSFSEGPKALENVRNEELKVQNEFENQAVYPVVKTAAEIATGVASLGSVAKDALHLTGLGKKAGEAAKTAAFQSLKPQGKAVQDLLKSGRAKEIGDQLLKDKIVTAGATWKTVGNRIGKKLEEYGEKIGYYAKSADKARDQDSAVRGVLVDDLVSDVNQKLIPKLIEEGASDAAQNVSNWVTSNLKAAAPTGEIGFQQAQRIKNTLDSTKAKFASANDTVQSNAFKQVYTMLNKRIEDGIETALQGSFPSTLKEFKQAKKAYGNLKEAEDFIDNTISRMSKNRMFSLTDYISGASGATAGGAIFGVPGTAAGLAAAGANKLIRQQGNQGLAAALQAMERKTPFNMYESLKAAGVLNPAVEMGK